MGVRVPANRLPKTVPIEALVTAAALLRST
jgi:hypothetical protein